MDWRRGIPWLDPNHTAVYFGGGSEVVLPNFQEVVHSREELRVCSESTVEGVSWLGHEPHRKLMLIHDDCSSECWSVSQELESEWRRDIVRDVGHTEIEERQLLFHKVTMDDSEVLLIGRVLNSTLELEDHSRVELNGNDTFSLFEELHCEISCTWSNL